MTFLAVSPFSSLARSMEPWLWLLVLIGYLRTRGHLLSLFFGIFLGIRALTAFVLTVLFLWHPGPGQASVLSAIAFYMSWAGFLAGFVVLLFAFKEIFHHILSPLPGLLHVGGIVFRWVGLVSLLLSCAVVLPLLLRPHGSGIDFVLLQVATGICALELCLVAFLVVAARTLGFSAKSRIFCICIGLMALALADIAGFSASSANSASVAVYICYSATILCLVAWICFFLSPEPVREFAHAPMKVLLRWNDLALALHPPEEPAEERTGFLHDVESMVDRVLARNASKAN
jgi:hypothetical protein